MIHLNVYVATPYKFFFFFFTFAQIKKKKKKIQIPFNCKNNARTPGIQQQIVKSKD